MTPVKLLLLSFLMVGCANTKIYQTYQGQTYLVAEIQGDATNVTVSTRRVYFHADKLLHSPATLAVGKASAQVLSSAGSVASAIVTHGIVIPPVDVSDINPIKK